MTMKNINNYLYNSIILFLHAFIPCEWDVNLSDIQTGRGSVILGAIVTICICGAALLALWALLWLGHSNGMTM